MAARILASRHRVALSTLCFMTLFFFAGPVSIEVCGLRAVDWEREGKGGNWDIRASDPFSMH